MALRKEFWAVEVKAGQPLKVNPGEATIIRLKQVSLGESKSKVSELVPVSVKFGGQKVVLATLSTWCFPQINFDLVFEEEFELSHNRKNGSVFFRGYSTMLPEGDEYSGESDKGIPLTASGNGNGEAKPSKPEANAAKPISSGKKENDSDDDSEDEDYSDEEDDETPMKNGKNGSGHSAAIHPKDGKTVLAAAAAAKGAGNSKQEQTPGCNSSPKEGCKEVPAAAAKVAGKSKAGAGTRPCGVQHLQQDI